MNEIALKEIQITFELPKIEYDLTALKTQIEELKTQYSNWVVQEDDLPQAKKIMASLNKSAKMISDLRIATAKQIKKPIDELEVELKAFTKDIDTLTEEIKAQVNEYEEKRKSDKHDEILALPEWVAEYMVFDESWLNKSVSIEEIKVNLARQKNDFQNNSLLITATCKALGLVPEKYYQKLVNHEEVNEIVALIQNDQAIKEQYQDIVIVEKPIEITQEDTKDSDLYTFTLKIKGTRLQLKLLKAFLEENKLEYEKL